MVIEYVLLDYLKSKMDVPVYMEEPDKIIDSYIIIEKTGSSETDHICDAVFAIQSYGKSLQDAIDLNENVKSVMADFIEQNIFSCKLNTDGNYTDSDTKRYRYQAVYAITY